MMIFDDSYKYYHYCDSTIYLKAKYLDPEEGKNVDSNDWGIE